MGTAIITMKVTPESTEVDINELQTKVIEEIRKFTGNDNPEAIKSEIKPFAFGLNIIETIFILDEEKGSTDNLEETLKDLEGAQGAEVTDMRRALG